MENNKTPSIRFKGFTDPWEQRKLGDQMFIKSRIGWQALTKKEYLETGDYYLITGTDIDEDKHIVDFNCCYYVSKERYEMDDKIQVYEGDIIVTKDGTIGKVAMVTGLDKPATLNSHLFVLRDLSGKLYNRFLLQVLVSHIFGDFVESTKTGSTLTGLPQKTFVEFRFLMPEMDEQMKIAQYLDNLDNLITLHQRKYNKLLNVKKSMLEKMFPKNESNIPEIRFKGFTDPWEQRKFSDVVEIGSGMDYKHLNEGNIPVYGTGGYMLSVDKALSENKDAIGIGRKGTIDKPYILKAPFWTVDTLFYCIPKDNYDLDFTNCLFQNIDWKKKDESTGVPSLSKVIINSVETFISSYAEQKKIGEYFLSVDHLITLHQRELEKLQNIKKSMLEKMFV